MVLYPLNPPLTDSATNVVSAWEAIERKQKQPSTEWWLIAQPDHAALSGALARHIDSPDFPEVDADILQAIALHDDGWAAFDSTSQVHGGRPVSFLEVTPTEFLRAWRGSIGRSEAVAPIGGILVSEHFCRIAHLHLQSAKEGSADAEQVRQFLDEEAERQARLSRRQSRSAERIGILVDLLQFCDLLSLYLCCGSRDSIEFPQRFDGRPIRLRREDQLCRMEPAIFGRGVSLAVRARAFSDFQHSVNIPLLLG